ncbi:MAG: hypothetical protein AB8V57_02735 [Coxiella endosymbiont of Dermacentor nuttalli]
MLDDVAGPTHIRCTGVVRSVVVTQPTVIICLLQEWAFSMIRLL